MISAAGRFGAWGRRALSRVGGLADRGPGAASLVLLLAGAAWLSRSLGTDVNWDLRNYHL